MSKIPKWSDGEFSDELQNLRKGAYKEAVGMNIICDDGIPRRVVEIVSSYRWPWKAIINETDPESKSGHFVNILSLSAQILGKPIPSKDQIEAFERVIKISYKVNEDGSFEKPPEGDASIYMPGLGIFKPRR